MKHGRYSTVRRTAIRELIEKHEADPDPLNILPELAAARALFQDYIERYDEWREAVIAWHQSYQKVGRPLPATMVLAFEACLDEYDNLLNERGEASEKQEADLEAARSFVELLRDPGEAKPTQVLDIADAYRIVSEITKIAARIEKIRAANAISRPNLFRLMAEMGRIVEHHNGEPDPEARLERIREGWLSIRLP